MNWKIELALIFYFFIGFFVNTWYYEKYKDEFFKLTDNQLATNFLITWVIWLPLYSWYLFRFIVKWIVRG